MSLYGRIFLPFLLSLMLGGAVAWSLAISLTTEALHKRLEDQLERAAAQLATGRLPLSGDLTGRLGDLLGAEIVLVSTSGPTVDATASELSRAVERIAQESPEGGRRRLRAGDVPYSVAIQPMRPGIDRRFKAVAAAMPLTEVQRASHRLALLLGFAAIAGTVVFAWVAHHTARGITRPLSDLAGFARRLATGDLGARAEIHGARELRQLAAALDDMADRLGRYQAEIAERNRLSALGEMAARIAHEIRNPLTAIKLHVELLAETTQGPEDRQTLARLLNEIKRLELVVSATLGLARRSEASLTPTDLNAVVEAVAELMRPQLAHRRIVLDCRLHAIGPASLDADRLKQVLLNLINNAADAMPQGGKICVTTGQNPEEGGLVLSVEDSGPGVSLAGSAASFSAGGSEKPHGLGLGLLICREIAELHGGRIDAEQGAALGGARFVLRLPVIAPTLGSSTGEAAGSE